MSCVQDINIIISCDRQKQIHPDEYVIPCFGGLSLELLLTLGLKRFAITAFNMMGCVDCENQPAADYFLRQISHLQDHAVDILRTKFVIITDPQHISTIDTEHRRSFLAGFKNRLVAAVSTNVPQSFAEFEKNTKQSRRIPKKVNLIRKALALANNEEQKVISHFFVNEVVVDEKCSLCPLCKGICPTGAIRIERSGKGKTLLIDNTFCSGCGLCVIFCKQAALTLNPPPGETAYGS